MNARLVLATGAAAVTAVAGLAPAFASSTAGKKAGGTLSFTDATPDPSPTALSLAGKRTGFCVGDLPAAPSDVNSLPVKVPGKGTLTVQGTTVGDWAMEIRDSKGTLLGGSDGGTPQDQEGASVVVKKPGTYQVVFCNLTGAPTATATWSFKGK